MNRKRFGVWFAILIVAVFVTGVAVGGLLVTVINNGADIWRVPFMAVAMAGLITIPIAVGECSR